MSPSSPQRGPTKLLVVLAGLSVGLAACSAPESTFGDKQGYPAAPEIVISARSGKIASYPCASCHAQVAADLVGDVAEKHREITLSHPSQNLRCTLCHSPSDMNSLHLIGGEPVSFDEPHVLCGQCHGERLRDFHLGAHGKTMGGWANERQRYTCTDCHNPHAPRIAEVVAMPAPPLPHRAIPKEEHP